MPKAAVFPCAVARAYFSFYPASVPVGRRALLFAALFLFCAFSLCPFPALAHDPGRTEPLHEPAGPGSQAYQGDIALLAMTAQENTASTLASVPDTRAAGEQTPWTERYFMGSFLGSFFLGYPYSGVGMPDIIVMVVAALLAVRLIVGRVLSGRRENRGLPKNRPVRKNTRLSGSSWAERSKSEPRAPGGQMPPDPGGAWPKGTFSEARPRTAPAPSPETSPGETEGDVTGSAPAQAAKNAQARSPAGTSRPADDADPGKERLIPAMQGQDYRPPAGKAAPEQWASIAPGVDVPDGFDAPYFLEWARSLYMTLQYAWAARQVDDLAPYVSRTMFSILKTQAGNDPKPVQVNIDFIHGLLADMRHQHNWAQVSILFTVSMRSGSGGGPVEIREVWRFACGGENSSWRVISIEQA